MKKIPTIFVICAVACCSNIFAQYPDWINYTSGQSVSALSDNGHELYYGPKPDYQKQKLPNGEKANLTNKKWRTSEHGDIFDGAGGRAGLKRSGFQGGMQSPMIVRWPGRIASGSKTDHLSAHYDFLATLADLVGGNVPDGKDSLSYLPTLLGAEQVKAHDYVIVNNQFGKVGRAALIARDGWKIVEVDHKKQLFQLYNLNDDNEERNNLASKYPERLATLKSTLLSELNSERPDL